MKKSLFITLTIMLAACNSNKSKILSAMDSTAVEDSIVVEVIDTIQGKPTKDNTTKEIKGETNKKPGVSLAGSYYCRKNGDTYVLNDDYSGLFLPRDGSSCVIEWYKTNNDVIITFTGEWEFLGTQRLVYDKGSKSLIEKSEIYGYLKYKKR